MQKKSVWVLVAGVVVVGMGYGLYRLFKGKESVNLEVKSTNKKPSGFCKYSGYPLRYGSCGKEVKELQQLLNQMIRPPHAYLKVDGKFGAKTKTMAKYYLQKDQISQVDLLVAQMSRRGIVPPE